MPPQPRPRESNGSEWTFRKVAGYAAGAGLVAYCVFGDFPPNLPDNPVETVEDFVMREPVDCYYSNTADSIRIGSMILVMVEPNQFDHARDVMSGSLISNWSITTASADLTDTLSYNGQQLPAGDATRGLMRDVAAATGVDLITFALDEEGGIVQRTSDLSSFQDIPAAADQDPSAIEDIFSQHAENLSGQLGVTMVLGPVTDVNQGGSIGSRSYGYSAEEVIQETSAVINGLHEGGVAAVSKHYPGYGSVAADTHVEVGHTVSFDSLQGNELLVYQQLINNSTPDGLMVSHAITDGLTNGQPASISPEVYTLARSQGFEGVMMTDALDMGGLQLYLGYDRGSSEGQGEAAVRAVQAGADMVIVTLDAGDDAVAALTQAVTDGRISQERINEGSARVFEQKGYEFCG